MSEVPEERLPQLPPDTELVTLHSAGSIPGIPGEHGVGQYLVHLGERSIKRVEDWLAEEAEKAKALLSGTSDHPASEQATPDAEPVASAENGPSDHIDSAPEPTPEETPAPAEDEASVAEG